MTIRFDEALTNASEFVRSNASIWPGKVILVRDVFGRIRIAVDDTVASLSPAEQSRLAAELNDRLGAYSPGAAGIFLLKSRLVDAPAVFESPDAFKADSDVWILERQAVGNEWVRGGVPQDNRIAATRVTFFGIKGGVGRSTALCVLAHHLASEGKKVLVVDLDLESPGIGPTLLGAGAAPAYGVVDWFVESGVGQAGPDLVRDMVSTSPLASGTHGEIRVAAAAGASSETYLQKLARAYIGLGESGPNSFSNRLTALVAELEQVENPDVVLLDSRAGLHDVAAAAITRLDAISLLFGVDSIQTWAGYRLLFGQWRRHADAAAEFKHNLKMVAGLVPETGSEQYVEAFAANAYGLFLDNLYEEEGTSVSDAFNYGVTDDAAPHRPLPIMWSRYFQEFDPLTRPTEFTKDRIQGAFGAFLRGMEQVTDEGSL